MATAEGRGGGSEGQDIGKLDDHARGNTNLPSTTQCLIREQVAEMLDTDNTVSGNTVSRYSTRSAKNMQCINNY